jgi:metal-responsive CopG/Arc/MetJ family transcriptional regulator
MRVRTSVTLPKELLVEVDALTDKKNGRSAVVESALIAYVAKEKPKKLNRRDIRIINENADLINRQVEETLAFQAEW